MGIQQEIASTLKARLSSSSKSRISVTNDRVGTRLTIRYQHERATVTVLLDATRPQRAFLATVTTDRIIAIEHDRDRCRVAFISSSGVKLMVYSDGRFTLELI